MLSLLRASDHKSGDFSADTSRSRKRGQARAYTHISLRARRNNIWTSMAPEPENQRPGGQDPRYHGRISRVVPQELGTGVPPWSWRCSWGLGRGIKGRGREADFRRVEVPGIRRMMGDWKQQMLGGWDPTSRSVLTPTMGCRRTTSTTAPTWPDLPSPT